MTIRLGVVALLLACQSPRPAPTMSRDELFRWAEEVAWRAAEDRRVDRSVRLVAAMQSICHDSECDISCSMREPRK